MPRPSLMDRPLSASFDAVSRRALAKWCAMKARDMGDILRMHQKARDLREAREMNAFLDTLRRPHDAKRWRLIQATERNSTSTRTLEQA